MIFESESDGMMEEVTREETRKEGAIAEVVYIVSWSCQDGESKVSVAKKPAVMMVVWILLVARALDSVLPHSGWVRSMEGIQWMLGPEGDGGGVEERDVP